MAKTSNGKHFGGASEPEQTPSRGSHFAAKQQDSTQPAPAGRHAASGTPKPPSTANHVTAPNRAHAAQGAPAAEGQTSANASVQQPTQVQPAVPAVRHGAGSHAAAPQTARHSVADSLPTVESAHARHAGGPAEETASSATAGRHAAAGAPVPVAAARRARHAGTAAADGLHATNGRRAKAGRADRPGKDGKPKRKGNVLSTVLIVVGVALLLVAGGLFIHAQMDYAATDANNEKLAAYATITDDGADQNACPITVDWESLKAVNDDVVGWIYIPGTNVNFPVYQGETNDTYLRTSATGEYAIGGQIFMDYENARPGMVDRQTIIYGHHLNNGAMFAQIDEFANQSGLESLQTIWYLTETATYELEPLCFYKTPATNADARTVTWATDDDFHSYLSGLVDQATAKSDAAAARISSISKVLTLCTCDYENDFGKSNGRGLLVCALKSEIDGTADTAGTMAEEGSDTSGAASDDTAAVEGDGSDDSQSI